MRKCYTCKIAKEMPDMACCAWYMDNVVCGDKTTEDCTAYIPLCDNCEIRKGYSKAFDCQFDEKDCPVECPYKEGGGER